MGCFGGGDPNKQQIVEVCKDKSEEQQKVIKYFVAQEGCMSKNISDDEYFSMVMRKRDSMNFKAKAIGKIGLDEDQINEIPPVMFEGFVYKNAYAKQRANGQWVSSAYQVAWLFFSATQVYIYRHTFNMDDDNKKESTDEFFYRDVTSFSTSSETERAHGLGDKIFDVETNKFCMVVPGDKLYVSMDGVKDSESIIQGMKQKLREKKMQ